jgi:ferredoxin-type protein NapH
VVLFYAPFALVARGVGLLFPASAAGTGVADVHTACMRMPLGWLVQPWMWGYLQTNPLYYLPIAVLPLAAVLGGPLFCGWLCPAGALPEFLSRLVPDRMKWDPLHTVEIVPIRYGFFVGFLFVPFVAASICCSFCNFTWMQNIVSGLTGNVTSWLYLGSTGIITMALWIVVLGLFTKGGRGWCLFLCPPGSFMSLLSAWTARFRGLPRVQHATASCSGCGACADVCSVRAIETVNEPEASDGVDRHDVKVNQYLCNVCLDCVKGCTSRAMRYGRQQ